METEKKEALVGGAITPLAYASHLQVIPPIIRDFGFPLLSHAVSDLGRRQVSINAQIKKKMGEYSSVRLTLNIYGGQAS